MPEPRYGLSVEYRRYRCRACGQIESLQTNHEGPCAGYCTGCSWKVGAHEIAMALNGRSYRWFDFAPEPGRQGAN